MPHAPIRARRGDGDTQGAERARPARGRPPKSSVHRKCARRQRRPESRPRRVPRGPSRAALRKHASAADRFTASVPPAVLVQKSRAELGTVCNVAQQILHNACDRRPLERARIQGHFALAGQGIGRLSPLSRRERGRLVGSLSPLPPGEGAGWPALLSPLPPGEGPVGRLSLPSPAGRGAGWPALSPLSRRERGRLAGSLSPLPPGEGPVGRLSLPSPAGRGAGWPALSPLSRRERGRG